MGRMRNPAPNAEKPRENCRYCVSTNSEPMRANTARATAGIATENLRSPKGSSSSIGVGVWRSHRTNAIRSTSATPPARSTGPACQPAVGMSMIDQRRRARPPVQSSAPGASTGRGTALFDSGTSHRAATSPRSATGTLMRNTEPHQ